MLNEYNELSFTQRVIVTDFILQQLKNQLYALLLTSNKSIVRYFPKARLWPRDKRKDRLEFALYFPLNSAAL